MKSFAQKFYEEALICLYFSEFMHWKQEYKKTVGTEWVHIGYKLGTRWVYVFDI